MSNQVASNPTTLYYDNRIPAVFKSTALPIIIGSNQSIVFEFDTLENNTELVSFTDTDGYLVFDTPGMYNLLFNVKFENSTTPTNSTEFGMFFDLDRPGIGIIPLNQKQLRYGAGNVDVNKTSLQTDLYFKQGDIISLQIINETLENLKLTDNFLTITLTY